jgi:predicted esterase
MEKIFFKVKFNNFREVSGSTANEVLDREEWDECEAVLCLPDSYSADGEPTPLILSCHGAGNTVCEADGKTGGIGYASECIRGGFAALDISGSAAHGLTFGCPEHIFALYKAYRYAIKHYNLTERVFLAGHSMGGGTAINFANTFPSLAVALAVVNPGLSMHGVTVGDHVCRNPWDRKFEDGYRYRAPLCQYFRFPEEEFRSDLIAGFEPYRTRSFVNAEGERAVFPPCPVKIWQGADDKTVDPVLSREYYDSIRRAGCYAELHILDGVAHKVTDTAKKEIAIWFERFL